MKTQLHNLPVLDAAPEPEILSLKEQQMNERALKDEAGLRRINYGVQVNNAANTLARRSRKTK
tara:strand:- start:224 stop:412 length:189 start_codon:yes stop_codon:yes gene_type:complete